MARRHIMLVGLPGAGKTTVGRLVAGQLGAAFVDFDALIEARAGKSVARIFAEDGEPAFRALEGLVGAEQVGGPAAVLSPGGGYVLDARRRQAALRSGLLIYLSTTPAEAARRLTGEAERPLLKGPDAVLRLHELLERREAAYLEAQSRVTTDGRSALDVADEVAKLARSLGGW